jgi:Tol biopolymer transport system component
MKSPLLYLVIVIALGLSSCASLKGASLDSGAEQKDYLVYQIDQRHLFLYDPTSNTHTQILTDWDINIDSFSLGTNNRLAFSSSRDGNSSVYVIDYPFTENISAKITFDTSTSNTPISWSPNGRYLLFETVQTDSKKLSLWDGKNFLDIYNYHGQINEVTWSVSGQLAFTEFFINDSSPDRDSGEVYIWDGNATVSASQNPSGEDRFPAWSKDGQLAFLSNRNGEYDIFVWDGASKNKGFPDAKTFVNIAPDLTQYFSSPTWTNTNSLAFCGGSQSDKYVQIYEWDSQIAKNISQNPSLHNGGQTWRKDGYWSFITFFSSSQNLYVRNNTNHTILETKGQYPPAWSQNGLLVFCTPDSSKHWILSMWNGVKIIEIAHGDFIEAKWNNGEYVFCSYG